ncbi:hypothetical protein CCR81_04850 [Halorhodospira halophila]|nr:hypothetical protein [Halorhodospira halophila]
MPAPRRDWHCRHSAVVGMGSTCISSSTRPVSRADSTDRGGLKRDRQPSGSHDFDELCRELAIEHRLTPPRRPQTNGLVERFNGRISEILRTTHFDSGADLDTMLWHYQRLYNHHIPQRALGHLTPVRKLKQWYEERPDLFRKQVYDQSGLDILGRPGVRRHLQAPGERPLRRTESGAALGSADRRAIAGPIRGRRLEIDSRSAALSRPSRCVIDVFVG